MTHEPLTIVRVRGEHIKVPYRQRGVGVFQLGDGALDGRIQDGLVDPRTQDRFRSAPSEEEVHGPRQVGDRRAGEPAESPIATELDRNPQFRA